MDQFGRWCLVIRGLIWKWWRGGDVGLRMLFNVFETILVVFIELALIHAIP